MNNADSDFLNPVFLRDTRQMFHSRVILVVMGILLLLELGQLCLMPLLEDITESDLSEDLGKISFYVQLVVINVVCLFCLVVSQTVTFSRERQTPDLDWSRMTVLSPFTIVLGKLYCAMCTVLLIYAIAAPFLYIAYFMRGIDQGQMIFTVTCLLFQQLLVAMFCILLGALGRKNIETLATIGGLAILVTFAVQNAIFSSGYFRHRYLMTYLCNNILAVLAIFGLLFVIAVAVLTPRTGNVMYWPRLYLGCLPWAILVLTPFYAYVLAPLVNIRIPSGKDVMQVGMIFFIAIHMLAACLISCAACFDRLEPGLRVLADRPASRLRRFFRFLFSSGRAGAILQSWLMTLIVFLSFVCIVHFFPGKTSSRGVENTLFLFGVPFFFLFYLQLASCLVLYFPSLKPIPVFFAIFILFLALPLLGYGISYHYFEEHHLGNRWLLLTTPFCLRTEDYWGVLVGIVLTVITGVPLLKYVFSHARSFIFESNDQSVDAGGQNA